MLSKKSQITLKPIIEMLAAITIFLIFIYAGRSFGTGEVFEKTRIAENNAQMINSLYAVPADASFFQDNTRYDIDFSQNSLEVFSAVNDPTLIRRFFAQGRCFDPEKTEGSSFSISKTGNCVIISSKNITSRLRCSQIGISAPGSVTMVPEIYQNQTFDFTQALSAYLAGSEVLEIHELTSSDMLIEIIPSETENRLFFKPDIQSRKLACLVANNILEQDKTRLSIQPSERKSFEKSDIGVALMLNSTLRNSDTLQAIARAVPR